MEYKIFKIYSGKQEFQKIGINKEQYILLSNRKPVPYIAIPASGGTVSLPNGFTLKIVTDLLNQYTYDFTVTLNNINPVVYCTNLSNGEEQQSGYGTIFDNVVTNNDDILLEIFYGDCDDYYTVSDGGNIDPLIAKPEVISYMGDPITFKFNHTKQLWIYQG